MTVFYLKYRPRTFFELDLKNVAKSLKKIVGGKRMPQSFLFCGPKGSGKTSAARILAKTINCLKLKKGEACLKCENCLLFEKRTNIDVIETDAASNRGIDDVRLLKDRAYLLPSKLKRKVFIIDEVHMLTKEAFNALLKLLEEPPKHTVFVLCTTDPEKIPETILSRLIRIDFRRGTKSEVRTCLDRVVKGEKIKVEKTILDKIVNLSEGSFRNAQKMLMELFLEFGQKITVKNGKEFFSFKLGTYDLVDFESDLLNGEVKKILSELEKMSDIGTDFRIYRGRLIEYFQKKLLMGYGVLDGEGGLNMDDLKRWLLLLTRAGEIEKESFLSQLPLQLAVVQFLNKNFTANHPSTSGSRMTGKSQITNHKKVLNHFVRGGLKKLQKKDDKRKNSKIGEKGGQNKVVDSNNEKGELNFENLENRWDEVLVAVKPFNHSVEAFLRAARPKSISGMTVVVEVFYSFHKDKLQEDRNRFVVERGLNKVFNLPLLFECVLAKREGVYKQNRSVYGQASEKKTEEGDMYDVAKEIFG